MFVCGVRYIYAGDGGEEEEEAEDECMHDEKEKEKGRGCVRACRAPPPAQQQWTCVRRATQHTHLHERIHSPRAPSSA